MKSEAWSYEDEYRLIYTEGDKYYGWPGRIASITFGLRMLERDKLTIRNALLPFEQEIEYYNTVQPANILQIEYQRIANVEEYFRAFTESQKSKITTSDFK